MRLALLLLFIPGLCAGADARSLIEESLRRHAVAPYLYEELTLISSDAAGRYTVRTARHYVRTRNGGLDRLVVIDTPHEARGSALLVRREAGGAVRRDVVLPALARQPSGAADEVTPSGPLFGTDFALGDLEDENPAEFRYEAEGDTDIERVAHHVVRAVSRADGAERRLYLRKDNLYVSRVEYGDAQGRAARRQTFRDPRVHDSGAWRAAMVLMENLRDGHRTLIKVERRVHSADYVPADVFEKR